MSSAIKESRNANGSTSAANVVDCDVVVSGTFVGAWAFKALLNGEWVTIQQGADSGGAYLGVRFAEPRQVRFDVTGYVSGTIEFNLAGRSYRASR